MKFRQIARLFFLLLPLGFSAHAIADPAKGVFPAGAESVVAGGLGLSEFKPASAEGWGEASGIALDPDDAKRFSVSPSGGTAILHNTGADPSGKKGQALETVAEYGDIELHAEFLISAKSNSGIYLMGRYEVQILDSFGKADDEIGVHDCGAIYERWNADAPDPKKRGYEGSIPRKNAARPAGEWQSLDIVFRAPEYDESGKKTKNATFLSVKLNGELIHENETCTGPTRGGKAGEVARGPIVFQGNHGPVAVRNVWVRRMK